MKMMAHLTWDEIPEKKRHIILIFISIALVSMVGMLVTYGSGTILASFIFYLIAVGAGTTAAYIKAKSTVVVVKQNE